MKKLRKKEKEAIDNYIDNITKTFPNKIESIILFGSKARGNFNKESDIDLMVIRNDKKENWHDKIWEKIVDMSGDLIIDHEINLSPKVTSKYSFYNTYSPFFDNVKKEGKILWSQKIKKNL